MAKCLVIKNADFSTNKVTTVTFNDISCTGVSFSSDSVTLDSLGTATINYTITPADTTDTVTLTSSDTSVLSISGETLTVNGIGTCTLTLSCGGYTATCTVTVDIYESPSYQMGYIAERTADDLTYCVISNSTNVVSVKPIADTSFTNEIYINDSVQNYKLQNMTGIEIPANATKIHIEATNLYSSSSFLYFLDMDSQTTISGNPYTKVLSKVDLTITTSSGIRSTNMDIDVPSGAKAFIVQLRPAGNISDLTTEAQVTEFAQETLQQVIHYLAE